MITKQQSSVVSRIDHQNNVIPNWKNGDVFTSDEVINAYFIGCEDGKASAFIQNRKVLFSQFEENIKRATSLSEEIMKKLKPKFEFKGLHLKFEDITSFKALFIISKSDFISDSFRDAYSLAKKYQTNNDGETFSISFSFTPFSDRLDEHCIVADGYAMKYEKK